MDSAPVNWEALDALIVEFAKSENLLEDSFSSSPPSSPSSSSCSSYSSSPSLSSSSYHSRLTIWKIRRSLEAGDIDAGMDLLRSHAPSILDDHRLLFRLQKQKFIEHLRKGTSEGRDLAIACLRTALAPCALDAYPEAYEEFKHVLLAFIYDKDDKTSPVANEVGSASYNCHFAFDLINQVDVQALAHAVELTRQGAVDSLRFSKGDLFLAFQNELCRMRLDVSMLDELVCEYCVYRGIVDSGLASTSGKSQTF
ncbi:hypothetical protein F2P56_013945, partial [Juglans regia]